jgi:acetylornithine deacetylase/succinyl-diaminopimelate desuccinylase-like protein
MPSLGRNAVHAMSKAVCWLEGEYASGLKQQSHPLLGPPTINVGRIDGGRQANIVPDYCEIVVDRRTLPGETERGVLREISAGLARAGVRAEVTSLKGAPCLPMETHPELPLVSAFLHSLNCPPSGAHYFCDAAIFAAGGTPSVVYGPGDIAQAHTTDEWISIASLDHARRRLARFLTSLS